MKLRLTFIVFIIFNMLLVACEYTVDMDFPQPDNKLTFNSLFCSDSVMSVYVSKITPVESTVTQPVNDLNIRISDGEGDRYELLNIDEGVYQTNKKMEEGKIYTISAVYNSDTLKAQDTIPPKVEISDFSYNPNDTVNTYYNTYYPIQLTFKDIPNQSNYYELFLYYEYKDTVYTGPGELKISHGIPKGLAYLRSLDPEIQQEGVYGNSSTYKYLVFSDNFFDGKNVQLEIQYYHNYDDEDPNYLLCLGLNHISRDYYRYKKQMIKNRERSYDFFYESGIVKEYYSNVSGGHGIFAAYSTDLDTIKHLNK